MRIDKILSINYGNKTTQKQQKQNNPNFGKLSISDSVSTNIIRELSRNPEIKELVTLFDKVGINLRAVQYFTQEDACALTRAGKHLRLVDPKIYKGSWANLPYATCLAIDGYEDEDIITTIKNLPKDIATKKFKQYYNESNYPKHFKKNKRFQNSLPPEYMERQQALGEVKDFNRTLSNGKNKSSFWKKLISLFN